MRVALKTENPIAALAWLVEAGADEAIGEAPVNRFQAKATRESNLPLEGGSKSAARSGVDFGGGAKPQTLRQDPSPKRPSAFSTLPQREGTSNIRSAGALTTGVTRASVTPTSALNPHTSDNDHIGRAIEIANACT